jgi:hypothetical protein
MEPEPIPVKRSEALRRYALAIGAVALVYEPFDLFHVPHRRPFFKNDGAVLAAIDGGRYLGVGGRILIVLGLDEQQRRASKSLVDYLCLRPPLPAEIAKAP